MESLASSVANIAHDFINSERKLPRTVTECPAISWVPSQGHAASLGSIISPLGIPASALSVEIISKRALPGSAATFRIKVVEDGIPGPVQINGDALHTLSLGLRVIVTVSTNKKVPLAYDVVLSSTSCINVSATIPSDAPLGSEVVLCRASVGGSDVPLGQVLPRVTLGYNHEEAPEGPVTAAAKAGDVPALMQALDNGGSTEERDAVGAYPTSN